MADPYHITFVHIRSLVNQQLDYFNVTFYDSSKQRRPFNLQYRGRAKIIITTIRLIKTIYSEDCCTSSNSFKSTPLSTRNWMISTLPSTMATNRGDCPSYDGNVKYTYFTRVLYCISQDAM